MVPTHTFSADLLHLELVEQISSLRAEIEIVMSLHPHLDPFRHDYGQPVINNCFLILPARQRLHYAHPLVHL